MADYFKNDDNITNYSQNILSQHIRAESKLEDKLTDSVIDQNKIDLVINKE